MSKYNIKFSAETISWENIPEALLNIWEKQYGADIVRAALRDSANWQLTHPLKKDSLRFLVNWLINSSRPKVYAKRDSKSIDHFGEF